MNKKVKCKKDFLYGDVYVLFRKNKIYDLKWQGISSVNITRELVGGESKESMYSFSITNKEYKEYFYKSIALSKNIKTI